MHIVAGTLFLLLAAGIPIVVALALSGVLGVALTQDVPFTLVASLTASASDSFILLAIPLFVLTGSLMGAGGIARRLFDFARVLVGHLTGGLAQVNVAFSVLYGGISGSSAADAAVACKVIIPQMRSDRYPAAFSGAISAVSGMLSNILPPAIALLVFASLANASVGELFVAGIVPGLLAALAMSITVHRICRRSDYGAATPRASLRDVVTTGRRAVIALLLPVVVVGGIRLGIFTPTEAGGVAAVVAFIVGKFVYRELRMRDLPGVLARAAVDTGVIMLIVSFSAPLAWVLAINQVPQQIAAFFGSFQASTLVFLLVVNIFLLIGGAVMEGVTLLVLVTPILAPVAFELGIDPVHFGIVMVVNVVIGAVTPPFGQIVFFVSSMSGIPAEAMFRQVLKFMPLLLVVLFLVTYVPEIYLWTVPLFGP